METKTKKRSVFSVGEIFRTFSTDPQKNDKAFKLAMFNGLAIIIVLIAIVTLCGVYFILKPFIKPLLWALLCGSALHPFKEAIANKCRLEIINLESSPRPLYLNILFLPFSLISRLSDFLGNFLVDHINVIIRFIVAISIITGLYFYTPNFVWRLCSVFMGINKYLLNFTLDAFNSTLIAGTVIIGFICALIFLWKPQYERIFSLSSIIVWIAVTGWFSNFSVYLRIPIFVLFQFSLCGGYIYSLACQSSKSGESTPATENVNGDSVFDFSKPSDDAQTSLIYIRWLMIICAAVITFTFPSFPYILMILLTVFGIKQLCIYFGIMDIFNSRLSSLNQSSNKWYVERKEILLPTPLKSTIQMLRKGKRNFLKLLKDCCDSVAAVAVILGLLIFGLFFSVFFTIQAYKEGVYLVQAGGSIINSTIVNNPELSQMLPEDWQTTKNTAVEKAYEYARDALAQLIRGVLDGKGIEEEKSTELERGALELWDRAYEAWVKPLECCKGQKTATPEAFFSSFSSFIERLKKTPEVVSWGSVRSLVQENMSTLSAGLDSVWVIVRGNMTLLISILTTLSSLLFGGGLSVINFTLHTVVFLTALFYLLSSSREMYKPVEIITQMSPKYGNRLALAVEQSCREVLAASTKLSLFYGLWTWLIHTVFMSNLVYMPAAFAAVLGVVPVLGTYWACLPAILDLWLLQDSKIRALGLFLAQIFPTAVVETTVYNEIKGGGHPYLTGLSIAGGMFWLGIEGAIAGPLILCFVFTIINMFSSFESITISP